MTDTTAIAKTDKSLEIRGLTHQSFRVLQQMVWPKTSDKISQDEHDKAVLMAVDYCKARGLDPFKKPLHIVPTWSSAAGKIVLTIWPGVNDYRTTAFRTREFAGKDPTAFGPTTKERFGVGGEVIDIEYPAWAQVTVYRISGGQRCPFPGPKVYWRETYATASHNTTKPNAMWSKRPFGQLEKCAEAAALRAAFPEEIGGQPTAEEMEGKTIDGEHETLPSQQAPVLSQEEVDGLLDAEAEIEDEMKSDTPPAEGPAPGLEPVGAPAATASTTTGGSARTDGRTRRGAQKQSAAPPATPAAEPDPSGQKGVTPTTPTGGGGTFPAKEPKPATDEQIERIEKAIRSMTPPTAAEFIAWAREMFGAIADDYLQYTYDEAVVAEGWIESKRGEAKASRTPK